MRRVALVAAVMMAVASCAGSASHPAAPVVYTSGAQAVTAVRHPALGVDLYIQRGYSLAAVREDGTRNLGYIKNVLKANTVGIVWDYFVDTDTSDTVERTRDTLTPQGVAILTKIARQDHLKVQYRPLIFASGEKNPWEGRIYPRHPAAWFDSYVNVERPYLKLAKQLHVPEFVAETEMHRLIKNPLWPSFFRRVSAIYSGITSYTNWDEDYFPADRDLLPTKDIGMDMYLPLKLPSTATSTQVTAAFERPFSKVPASVLERTEIDETGIQARAGAFSNPENMRTPGRRADQVQANWFHAACETVHRFHLRGVFFWKVDLADYPSHPATSLSTFEGRQAARSISNCRTLLN